MKKLKVNDEVIVVSGKEKGKTGKVLKLLSSSTKVIISGVNLVKKTVKPDQSRPNGAIEEKEAALHRSKVMHVSPKNGKPTRIKIDKVNGKNKRVTVSCNNQI